MTGEALNITHMLLNVAPVQKDDSAFSAMYLSSPSNCSLTIKIKPTLRIVIAVNPSGLSSKAPPLIAITEEMVSAIPASRGVGKISISSAKLIGLKKLIESQ